MREREREKRMRTSELDAGAKLTSNYNLAPTDLGLRANQRKSFSSFACGQETMSLVLAGNCSSSAL